MPLIINQIMIQTNLIHILNLLSFHPLHNGLFWYPNFWTESIVDDNESM